MKRSPATRALLSAAVSGITLGLQAAVWAPGAHAATSPTFDGHAGVLDTADAGAKHACKGQNACKGQGGCKTDKHACRAQNDCKGQGGCRTDGKM
jgi:hypothetical protein